MLFRTLLLELGTHVVALAGQNLVPFVSGPAAPEISRVRCPYGDVVQCSELDEDLLQQLLDPFAVHRGPLVSPVDRIVPTSFRRHAAETEERLESLVSGFITDSNDASAEFFDDPVKVREGRTARIGNMGIVRALPTKGRRTIGAWCLLDVMLPGDELDPDPLEIGPHPHTGLSTVTWLLEGEALHSDSLGTEQIIRPGQLNLMSAGSGVAHAELSGASGVRGIQMWVAQPDATRTASAGFEHHSDLPVADLKTGQATVFVGSLAGADSPARQDTPLLGADLTLGSGSITLPADPTFEYGIVPVDGRLVLNGAIVEEGWLGMITESTETLVIESEGPARAILIGGEPLGWPLSMWWNFVGRTKDEITDAWRDWQAGDTDRYPEFPSVLDRIDAPTPPWIRMVD